jgi:hypothetical protein
MQSKHQIVKPPLKGSGIKTPKDILPAAPAPIPKVHISVHIDAEVKRELIARTQIKQGHRTFKMSEGKLINEILREKFGLPEREWSLKNEV